MSRRTCLSPAAAKPDRRPSPSEAANPCSSWKSRRAAGRTCLADRRPGRYSRRQFHTRVPERTFQAGTVWAGGDLMERGGNNGMIPSLRGDAGVTAWVRATRPDAEEPHCCGFFADCPLVIPAGARRGSTRRRALQRGCGAGWRRSKACRHRISGSVERRSSPPTASGRRSG